MIRGLVLSLAVVLGSAGAQAQQGRNPPAEHRAAPYAAFLPLCHSGEVLGEMTAKFNLREAQYWNSNLAMVGFDRVHETGWRSWGREFVPRRYCSARAYTNDGRRRHVRYFVRETWGRSATAGKWSGACRGSTGS